MSKKIFLFLLALILFLISKPVQADVVFSEIQLSPVGNKFIEIYNSGDSVDLTGWSIKRKTSSGTEYSLVSSSRLKGKVISENNYFLIGSESGYLGEIQLDATWPSSYSISNNNSIQLFNSNQEKVDEVGWGECADFCVATNPTENKSIQKIDSEWFINTSTPGEENSSADSEEDQTDQADNIASTTTKVNEIAAEVSQINKVKILVQNPAFAGVPVKFEIKNSLDKNCGKYYWSYGDGAFWEDKYKISDEFWHTYTYAGNYIVSLECYKSYLSDEPESSDKINLKVVESSIFISKTGQTDFFVEITNSTNYQADISGWSLASLNRKFIFPRNTLLKAKEKTIFPAGITGLTLEDKNSLALYNSEGKLMPTSIKSVKSVGSKKVTNQDSNSIEEDSGQAEENNLTSNLVNLPKFNLTTWSFVFFFLLIISSSLVVYFIRQTKKKEIGQDFDILDE